jgi:hypothetical protein
MDTKIQISETRRSVNWLHERELSITFSVDMDGGGVKKLGKLVTLFMDGPHSEI